MKILIAEDNPMWLKLLEDNVKQWAFDPVSADNGETALELLQENDAARLAVLDWQMPKLDGVEVCRRIKGDRDRPYTYVVLLTGRDAKEDIVAGLDAGADDYLTKPVDLAVLKSRLAAARRIVEAIPPQEWSRPRIAGYDVHRVIGKGAFATVWEATHEATGRQAALKVLRVDLATETVFERFAREIRVLEELDHPYLVKIYDSQIDRKIGYYAMDLISGGTLHDYVKREHPVALRIIRLIAKVCEGLQYAHERGIVHRDLKLTNIMVTDEGEPKVVDFGMSKSMFRPPEEDPLRTLDGSVIGTPLFMAPEQARGEVQKLDGRSDIYAVGIILYMLLLRQHPHQIAPDDRDKTLSEIGRGLVRPPRELKANFNQELENILLKSLAPKPDDRYQTAGEFAEVLNQFVEQRRTSRPAST